MYASNLALHMPRTSLGMHREGIHSTRKCFPWGTIYGTIDGLGKSSVAAILGPGDHPRQQKLAIDGRGDSFWGPSMA